MKFVCTTQQLLQGVQLASRAIGGDQTLPILQNILLRAEGKRCTISATNLELSIVTGFDVIIENEGGITIPAKALLNFIQYNHDEEILLETKEDTQLKLQSKHAKAVIAGEAVSGYPSITSVQKENVLKLPAQPLLHALNVVTFACAKTTSRPVISGVFVKTEKDQVILVGTDSYRLSEYKIPIEGQMTTISCIIPARFLEELKGIVSGKKMSGDEKKEKGEKKMDDVELSISSQQVEAVCGPTRIVSRLIDGKFPDYLQVLPKEKNTSVIVPTLELQNAVKRMHYFAKEVNNNITFSVSKGTMLLTTKETQIGKDESSLVADVEGQENKIAISSNYLIDFLSRIDDESVVMELLDKAHPAVFTLPANKQFLHLIMPLRMTEE